MKVELHPAHSWDCDNCGVGNFCRAIVTDMTQEDIDWLVIHHGGEPSDWNTGNWMTRPDEVTCDHCGMTFETQDHGEDTWEAFRKTG